MKLTVLKGIAHDLAHHLNLHVSWGKFRDKKDIKTNVLKEKTQFEEYCVNFFKERLPDHFDFDRIDEILVDIYKSEGMSLIDKVEVKVTVEVDDYKFSQEATDHIIADR